MMTARKRPNPESGFAMLLVFVMAAIIAIGLYQQLPRAAFESQRDKEALLIAHGEQYRRGIQLYCRKMGRYPSKMEDLDNTQNIRFLRKHYIDPMTGKDEWRLLHMGPAGKLIDSKVQSLDTTTQQSLPSSVTEFKHADSADQGSEGVNLATRRRPSDDVVLSPNGASNSASPNPQGMALNTSPNNMPNPMTGGGIPLPPGSLNGGAQFGGRGMNGPQLATSPQGQPNAANSGSSSSVSGNGGFGSSVSGNGGFGAAPVPPTPTPAPNNNRGFGAPVNSQFQGQSPYSTAPGANQPNNGNFGNPGNTASPAQMINNLLTSPRPGGAPAGVGLPGMGGSVVGGLAGVASTHKGHGIHWYADQDEYQKWEFYYDFAADARGTTAAGMQNLQNNNQNPNQNPNNPATNNSNGFGGNNSSFNNGSSFNNNSGAFNNNNNNGSSFGNNSGSFGGTSPQSQQTTTTTNPMSK